MMNQTNQAPHVRQHQKLIIGIVLGVALGIATNALWSGSPNVNWVIEHMTDPIGKIFLRLLFMLVIPLVFSALVIGICELDLKHLGRMGLKMLGYTIIVSAIAVIIGLTLVNVIGPGRGLSDDIRNKARTPSSIAAAPKPADTSAMALLVAIVPDNPVKAAATGDMIGVITFALFIGIGLALTTTSAAQSLRLCIQGLYDVAMQLIEIVLKLSPLGVGALLFNMTARMGTDVMRQLAAYIAVVLLGLGLHMFVVYAISVKLLGRRSPLAFFRDVRLAMITAFSTASSSATLPTALHVAEHNLKLPNHISRFVLTAGSTMNQNGTALFEGVTVLFLAQLFNVDLQLGQQALIMLICILAGIGTAGVPAGSIPVIAMILGMFGIPAEGLGLVLGVDRLLDMCRTTVNVTGDLAAAVYVAHGEETQSLHGITP